MSSEGEDVCGSDRQSQPHSTGTASQVAPGAAGDRDGNEFRPIFVVGCQRSGTTALAVMFDRHSHVAMLPETAFLTKFVVADREAGLPMSREALVRRAMEDPCIKEAKLGFDEVAEALGNRNPTYPNLFRAILECYARKHGKGRPGEKTCGHRRHVRDILRYYPGAKIICIVRDGRDVVLSTKKASWGQSQPLTAFCRNWILSVRCSLREARELPSESYTLVKYEDLMAHPEREIKRLCKFIGEDFEPSQLRGGADTDVVPESELEWKAKAMTAPDPSRVAAWRQCGDRMLVARLTYYMGGALEELGYPHTRVRGVSRLQRLGWAIRYVPCRRGVFPIALRVNRVIRFSRSLFSPIAPKRTQIPVSGDSCEP